ncbi:MAG: acyl carrier protein [Candidatus Omnitrophota bacterium]
MQKQKILDRIKKVFQTNVANTSDLSDVYLGIHFKKIVSLDSLALLRIMVALEKEFKIKFDLDSLGEVFRDIHTIETYILSKE